MSTEAHGNGNAPAANEGAPEQLVSSEETMVNRSGGAFSTEDVVQSLRIKNVGKEAAIGAIAYLQNINSATDRLSEYCESAAHAHETGNLDEMQGLLISILRITSKMSENAYKLSECVERESAAHRAVA